MNYKLLAVSTGSGVNIGDYIQALASSQFLPHIDGYIERERLLNYSEGPCRVIMNGWYLHDAAQWPPSDLIDPLFVAVHFNSTSKEKLLEEKSIDYLKMHEPIGCRDYNTMEMLQAKGVDAYFSGCMTLTLGLRYKTQERSNHVYFVDPYFVTKWNPKSFLNNLLYLAQHYQSVSTISKKHPDPKKGFRKKMIITTFFREYRKYFTDDTLINAHYICQQSRFWQQEYPTNDTRLAAAEDLIKMYAKASLVVTSRIHCALPCLGLETPVIYVENCQQSEASACRFKGLRELFTIIRWDHNHLIPEFDCKGKISSTDNIPENKNLWQPLAQQLITKCTEWVHAVCKDL